MLNSPLGVVRPDIARWWPLGARFAADFVHRRFMKSDGPVAPGTAFSFARASGKYAADLSGSFHSFAAHEPAITDSGLNIEPAATELMRNTSFAGALGGLMGAGGALPGYGWSGPGAGLSVTVALQGLENGLPCLDLRFWGTPSGNAFLLFETRTQIAGVLGESVGFATRCRRVAGSAANISALGIALAESDAAGNDLSSSNSTDFLGSIDSSAARMVTRTLTHANAAYVLPYMRIGLTAGQPIDLTLRFSQMSVQKNYVAGSPILTAGAPETRAADALALALPPGELSVYFCDSSGVVSGSEPGGAFAPFVASGPMDIVSLYALPDD